MLQTAIAIILILHGLVHPVLAAIPYEVGNPSWPNWWDQQSGSASWIISRGGGAGRVIGIALWIGAALGFVLAGLSLLGILPVMWWPVLAPLAAVLSLLITLLFWHPWLVMSLLINGAVLVAIVLLRWPAAAFGGIA